MYRLKGRTFSMSKPCFKFSSLRCMLLDLGFKKVPVMTPSIGFQHDEADLLIVLPRYRSGALVAPHHLVYVRMMLDGKGLMDAEEFNRVVGLSQPVISFADLRQILLDLGLTEVVVPKSHVGFLHADSGTDIFLPIYGLNQRVAPRHLAVVRAMLDAKGLLDGEEFDRLVADVAARHSVSG